MDLKYCSVILLVFAQVVQARPEVTPSGALCNEIKLQGTAEFCKTVADKYPNGRQAIENNCNYARERFSISPEDADNLCVSTFDTLIPWAESKAKNLLLPTSVAEQTAAHTEEAPPRVSAAMNQCLPKPFEEYACTIPNELIGPDFQMIMFSPMINPLISFPSKDPRYTVEACQCFKKQSEESEKKGPRFERQIKREKEKINELVFNSAGVRILNNIAANLEDVNFYRANDTSLLGGDANARKLLCNDAAKYRSKVKAACNKNNVVKDDVINERMSDILSSLGDSKRDKTLEEKFATIEKKVLGGEITAEVEGVDRTLTRNKYDQIRFGAAKGLPEVNFINDVTYALLSHPVLGAELTSAMENDKHTPGRAIFSMIKKEGRPEVKELLLSLANQPKNKGELSQEIIALLATPNETDLEAMIEQRIAKTLDTHPSLKAVFKNTELFNKVREAARVSGSHSLLVEMEKNPSFLSKFYEERCEKLQDQFAEAICVPNNDFISLTNREDLNHLLTPFEEDINQNLKDLILCQIPEEQNRDSVFQKLAFRKWDKLGQSDYWRGKKPGESEGTFLSAVTQIVQSGNSEAIGYLGGLTRMGDSYRKPDREYVTANSLRDSFSFGKDTSSPTTPAAAIPEEERDYAIIKGLSQISETMGGAPVDANQPNQNFVNYSAPLPQVADINNDAKTSKDKSLRSALKDFLADEENAAEIDKHLSQTKEEDHRELNRLKDELAKNKEMITSLTNQTEQNKLKALQDRYRALENDELKNASATSREDEEEDEVRSNSRSNIVSGGNSINSNNPGEILRDNNVATSAQTSGSESGSGSAASRSPSSIGNARVNAQGLEGNMAFSSSAKGEIMIEQSSAALLVGKQLAPEDLGLVIQKYVEQTELDVQTLKQLRDQEVVIKYKVFENGVEVLKTMKVKSTALTPETKKFLAAQIAIKEKEVERLEARRAHSFATLKLLLGIKTRAMN